MNRGKSIVRDWTDVDHLAALEERLHGVTLEHDDALKVIERYDTPRTLHYVDPPYPAETRNPRWAKKGPCSGGEAAWRRPESELRSLHGASTPRYRRSPSRAASKVRSTAAMTWSFMLRRQG